MLETISCLISPSMIHDRVKSLGQEISDYYNQDELTIISVLSGSVLFVADLIRELPQESTQIGFIGVSSYFGKTRKKVRLTNNLSIDVRDRHVLVVDDILDSGKTLEYVQDYIRQSGATSARSCVLLKKTGAPSTADFVGFDIDDKFVVGYGLDYNGYYRNCPYIGVLENDSV